MNFTKAKQVLASGVPIIHDKYGIIYTVGPKESFFVEIGGKQWKKVVVTNIQNLWIYQPQRYTEEYINISSLNQFENSDGWEIHITNGRLTY